MCRVCVPLLLFHLTIDMRTTRCENHREHSIHWNPAQAIRLRKVIRCHADLSTAFSDPSLTLIPYMHVQNCRQR